MKYKYLKPYKGNSPKKCLICNKGDCDSIDNIGTLCHWECLNFPETPEDY